MKEFRMEMSITCAGGDADHFYNTVTEINYTQRFGKNRCLRYARDMGYRTQPLRNPVRNCG